MRVNNTLITVGDVITDGAIFGIVAACAYDGGLQFIVDVLEFHARISTYGWHFNRTGEKCALDASSVAVAAAWKLEDGRLLVLLA